jgi:hypothetical protein
MSDKACVDKRAQFQQCLFMIIEQLPSRCSTSSGAGIACRWPPHGALPSKDNPFCHTTRRGCSVTTADTDPGLDHDRTRKKNPAPFDAGFLIVARLNYLVIITR